MSFTHSLRTRIHESETLILVAGTWFTVLFLRYAFPPLFETLQNEFLLSNTQLGLLFSVLMFCYAAMQFPSGMLSDHFGEIRVITAGIIVFSSAAMLLVLSQSFVLLVTGVVLIGLGTGAYKTVAINLLSIQYPTRRGRALGLMDTVGQFGGVVAPAAVVFLLSLAFGWRTVFLTGAIVGFALAGLFYSRTSRDRSTTPQATTNHSQSAGIDDLVSADRIDPASQYATMFLQPKFLTFVLITMLYAFSWNGVIAFLPLYLTTVKNLSSELAGLLYGIIFLVAFAAILIGELSDRLGRLIVISGTLLIVLVGVSLLVVTGNPVILGGVIVIMGAGFHGFRVVRDSYLTEVIPLDIAGGTLGIVRTIMMITGSIAPTILGVISDIETFAVAFQLVIGLIGLALALSFLLVWQQTPHHQTAPT